MRVEWTTVTGAEVASLIGDIGAHADEAIAEIATVAARVRRLVVDLHHVADIDGDGLGLVRRLAALPNVSVQNPSAVVVHLCEVLGVTL